LDEFLVFALTTTWLLLVAPFFFLAMPFLDLVAEFADVSALLLLVDDDDGAGTAGVGAGVAIALMTSCFPFHTLLDGTGAGVGAALPLMVLFVAASLDTFTGSTLDVGSVLMDVLESVEGPNIFSLRPFHTEGPLMVSVYYLNEY
jgi:hypothetical protein